MRRIFIPLSLFILLAALGSCNLRFPPLWIFDHSDGTPEWDSTMNTSSFLELKSDGSYTRDFGEFEYGTWIQKDHRLYLTNQQHTTYIFSIKEKTHRQMQLVFGEGRTGYFNACPQPESRQAKDPFSLENNRWRLTATHRESETEIRERLFNHFQFWITYFNWASDHNIEKMDVRNVPTPMKIYANGFGLKHFDDLPARWKSGFFDEEDCRKADTLIKKTFRHHKINWPDSKNTYTVFASGFQQMQQYLR